MCKPIFDDQRVLAAETFFRSGRRPVVSIDGLRRRPQRRRSLRGIVSGGGRPFFFVAAIFFFIDNGWEPSCFLVFGSALNSAFVSYYSNTVIIITVPSGFFETIVNVS